MAVDAGMRQVVVPERRTIEEGCRLNHIQCFSGDTDLRQTQVAAQYPARHQQVTWLQAKEGDARIGLDHAAAPLPG